MKLFKKLLVNYKNLIKSRKISIVLYIVIILSAQVISVLGAISFLNISLMLTHIRIPSGFIYIDTDIYAPETMVMQIPYEIPNPGIYNLIDIKLNVEMRVNYLNASNRANITSLIFSKTCSLKTCKAFSTLLGDIEGGFINFIIQPLLELFDHADEFEIVYYLLDFKFSARYFFGLIKLHYIENNLNIFDF